MEVIAIDHLNDGVDRLIQMSARSHAYIICRDKKTAHEIFKNAAEKNLDIPLPITHSEFLDERFYAKGVRAILIESADLLLIRLARGCSIEAITLEEQAHHANDRENDTDRNAKMSVKWG